jgi:hypothetical protein
MAYSTRYLPGKDDVRGELDNLAADIAARTEPDLLTSIQVSSRVDASANQQLRLKPPPGGMALTLPAPQQGSMGDEVIVILEDPEGPLRVTALPFQEGSRGAVIRNTVNGGETATFTSSGRIVFASNGDTRWLTTNELPNEAPQVQAADDSAAAFGDAEVLLGSASVAFPNGRVATDSTEIDADTTLVGLISWALKVASVGLSKLEDLTGLSVLGRAASSAGVMAAITATAARQVLRANNAGNALEWGFPIEVQDESVDQGDVHTINFTDGINATVAAGVATVNALPQLRVVSFTGGLLDVSTFNHNDTIILNCASSSPFTLTGITARSEGTRFFVVVNAIQYRVLHSGGLWLRYYLHRRRGWRTLALPQRPRDYCSGRRCCRWYAADSQYRGQHIDCWRSIRSGSERPYRCVVPTSRDLWRHHDTAQQQHGCHHDKRYCRC